MTKNIKITDKYFIENQITKLSIYNRNNEKLIKELNLPSNANNALEEEISSFDVREKNGN